MLGSGTGTNLGAFEAVVVSVCRPNVLFLLVYVITNLSFRQFYILGSNFVFKFAIFMY